MPVKVLHVFGAMARGGAELRTLELIETLDPQRIQSDFAVLGLEPGPLESRARHLGCQIHKCPLDSAFAGRFMSIVRSGHYDVVHSHLHYFTGPVLLLAACAGVPRRIAHFRTSADDHAGDSVLRTTQRVLFRKMIDLFATDILGVSEGVLELAWRSDWSSDRRCQVIYNGIAPQRLNSVPVRSHSRRRLINVASVQRRKNQLRLLNIFQACLKLDPEVSLVIVGRTSGDYAASVREEIQRRGLEAKVQLIGEVHEPLEWIKSAAVMVMPSLWEGLPGAALEAAAVGLPVVTSALPGALELARSFPSVRCLPLDQSDAIWAHEVCLALALTSSSRADAYARYSETPFCVHKSRDKYYAVWERGTASASHLNAENTNGRVSRLLSKVSRH